MPLPKDISSKRDATLVVGNQPKPSFKENKKNPVKDISKDILPLPGFRDKPEDTELIKLIKERQIKPRGPKQPYELPSGAVTPTASPIDAVVVGAAGIPQLVGRGVAGALSYLDAPLTVGSKVLPSVTANNLLKAAGAAYSGEQIINPESELRTNPNPENILMTGLGLVGLPYKAAGLSFADDLGQVGKYLTEETALKNAYNYNPWAEKLANPNRSYRVAGMDAARDFEATGVLRSNPTIVPADLSEGILGTRTTPFPSFQKGYADLRYLPEEGGVIFETDLPTFKRGEINPFTGKQIKGSHYAHRVIDPTTGKVLTEIPSENVRMFGSKPHWLRGYKPIKVSKPTSSFKSEIDWGKWNPETPNYPELINEYNAIEESTKKAGTWMKNPDGSAFQGTPEQFIQQQSSWFKKAFPNYYNKIVNHNSPNKFNEFSDKFFSKTSDEGWYGKGVYTHPDKSYTKDYGDINYELYVNSNNKGFINENNIQGAKYYKKSYKEELKNIDNQISSYIKEIKDNPTDYIDQEFFIERVNNMGKLKKATLKNAFRNKLNNNIDSYSTLENPQNGEVVIPFNNLVKSAVGNIGFFDMTNPNIYKGLIPPAAIIGAAASQKQEYKYGGNIPMKLNKYNYGKNMYFPYGGIDGGASILNQSNLKTGEVQAKENTVLDKNKKVVDTKPVISNPSLYSGKQKQVDTASTIGNIGSDISKEINKYSYKPISTTPINYGSSNPKIGEASTFSQSVAPVNSSNIEAPKVDTYQMSTETDLPAPGPTVTSEQLGQGPELNADTNLSSTAGKTSGYNSQAASNIGGTTATALNIGNQIYNATKNVDDKYNQDLASNEKYNKEYSQAQEKYKKDQGIVDTTATTLSTIGAVMSAIPVVNAFSWIPMLLGAGTKAIGDPIVDADYQSNTRGASIRNFNMASPEEYNRSMKVSNKNILAPESNQARYGGKMFSYGGNIYKNGGKTNSLEGDLISKVIMNRNKDKDFVQRAYAVGEYPESNMFTRFDPNQFGQKNSHLMSWGEDKSGQAYMSPEVMNPNNEAIKVPNQYADYISSEGYKKVAGMQYANGGMTMYNMPKGLTHEQHPYGGYPIGNNNYVESDEVVLDKPDGSKYIFSNRIKYKR